MRRRFQQVDVFTAEAFLGNPVAVVLDGDGLTAEQMQRFANWTNLSETTFVTAPSDPSADYAVRIFTRDVELPFAGHPTLGTCHAWLTSGGAPARRDVIVQECGAGLIPIRRKAGALAFEAPPLLRTGPLEEATVVATCAVLRIDPSEVVEGRWVDNGPGWLALLLRDADAVLALEPDPTGGRPLDIGVVGLHPPGGECAVEVRAFFCVDGPLAEDPVTGSLNAGIAPWLIDSGRVTTPYVASQGTALGRRGRVHVDRDADGSVWVGGGTVTCIDGRVEI